MARDHDIHAFDYLGAAELDAEVSAAVDYLGSREGSLGVQASLHVEGLRVGRQKTLASMRRVNPILVDSRRPTFKPKQKCGISPLMPSIIVLSFFACSFSASSLRAE